jgi:hypothetical protein
MIRLVNSYQRDIQILMIYFIQIQQDLYDFTLKQDLTNPNVIQLRDYSYKISEFIN